MKWEKTEDGYTILEKEGLMSQSYGKSILDESELYLSRIFGTGVSIDSLEARSIPNYGTFYKM